MATEQRLYCGATDLALSEAGVAELVGLKKLGAYPKSADLYFTSGFKRTEQTLDLLYGAVQRTALPALAEFNFGSFEMKSYEMLKEQSDYVVWIADEAGHVCCPGGESKLDFARRAIEGYGHLAQAARNGTSVLAVCHGGVVACIMEHLFPDTRNFYEWRPDPGRGYTIFGAAGEAELYKTI